MLNILDQIPASPGWHPLILDLERRLRELDPHGYPIEVKSKFGGLRVSADPSPNCERWEEFQRLVEEAEERSKTICERCGKPGQLRDVNDWLWTLCDGCFRNRTAARLPFASRC